MRPRRKVHVELDSSGKALLIHQLCAGEYHLLQERRQECFIIASEPLSVTEEDRRDWVPVPKNHCVVVTQQHNLLLCPIDP